MLVEVIRARMKEADAKATDLKASFENLCESAKREIDAFEEEERELILIEDLHSKEVEKIHYEKVMNNKVLPEIKAAEAQYEEIKNLRTSERVWRDLDSLLVRNCGTVLPLLVVNTSGLVYNHFLPSVDGAILSRDQWHAEHGL